MATAFLRACSGRPGCPSLVTRGLCPECSRARERSRGSAAARGYGHRWRLYRRSWLERHPFCGDRRDGTTSEHSVCAREGRATQGEHVDHIVPVSGPNDERFWDPTNHQTLCASCHSIKTTTEDGGFGRHA
jgi:5-methylcytosine-specific restriction protein A